MQVRAGAVHLFTIGNLPTIHIVRVAEMKLTPIYDQDDVSYVRHRELRIKTEDGELVTVVLTASTEEQLAIHELADEAA